MYIIENKNSKQIQVLQTIVPESDRINCLLGLSDVMCPQEYHSFINIYIYKVHPR